MTSFAVVRRLRGLLGGVRAGHAGSLDPFATGLLPVCVGRATRLVRFVSSGAKRYTARVRFGQATDTDDPTGKPVGPPAACPDTSAIRRALPGFLGAIEQRPPRFSAKHVGGRRAYRLARAGEPVELAPAPRAGGRTAPAQLRRRDCGDCLSGWARHLHSCARPGSRRAPRRSRASGRSAAYRSRAFSGVGRGAAR